MSYNNDFPISRNDDSKTAFFKKTYMHVAFAVLAFIVLETVLLNFAQPLVRLMSGTGKGIWIAILFGFGFVTNYAQKLSLKLDKSTQYLGLGIFVLAYSVLFLPLINQAVYFAGGAVINQAAILTLSLFTGLSAVALMGNTDFSFLRSALTIGSFVALGLIVAGWIFGFNLGLWFSVGMVVLSAGGILYETSNLKNVYNTDQYVGAAASLFGSLMMMFWYILRIVMRSND